MSKIQSWVVSTQPHVFSLGDYVTFFENGILYYGIVVDLTIGYPDTKIYGIAQTDIDWVPMTKPIKWLTAQDLMPLVDINKPSTSPICECGNKHNPIGQGHSQWCDLFKPTV